MPEPVFRIFTTLHKGFSRILLAYVLWASMASPASILNKSHIVPQPGLKTTLPKILVRPLEQMQKKLPTCYPSLPLFQGWYSTQLRFLNALEQVMKCCTGRWSQLSDWTLLKVSCAYYSKEFWTPCHLAWLIPNEWPASLLSLVFTSSSAMWSSRRSDKLTSQLSQY